MSSSSTATSAPTPAESLVGRRLAGRWFVSAPLGNLGGTGGVFSSSYVAIDENKREVFVKALDLSAALSAPDFTRSLQSMTEAYNFERDLLKQCGDRRLDRIVKVLADGEERDPTWAVPVPYLVFERAELGDVRTVLASMERLDLAFAFRSLHNVAVGLQQLHSIGVAHQDIKPSNIVVFENDGSKIADLGRSSTKEREAQWDQYIPAGDPNYCPPEQMYGYASMSWERRREATDLYHLGSMVLFIFAGISAKAALLSKLDPAHYPYVWQGTHMEVLPYLLTAFDDVLVDLRQQAPPAVADQVCDILRWLSHPDLEARGHPSDRAGGGSNYSLQRFVTLFDRLARNAENGLTPPVL